MPNPDTFGAFTRGVARLSEHGDLAYDSVGNPVSTTDTYSVWLGNGVRATSANVSGIPAANSSHISVAGLFVSSIVFTCISIGNGVWNVIVEYERDSSSTSTGEDGTLKITSRSWESCESIIDFIVDAETGEPIINSAGDPFDSIPQRPIQAPKLTFVRMESRDPNIITSLNGTVNNGIVIVLGQVFLAYGAKIRTSVRDTMATSGMRYECTYEIEARVNKVKIDGELVDIGWRDALIESGYTYWKDEKRYKFTERTRNSQGEEEEKEASSPQLLTATGGDGRNRPAVLKLVTMYRPVSWSTLKLPESR